MADENHHSEAGESDLSAMSRLACCVSEAYRAPDTIESWTSEETRRNVQLVARLLGKVRTEMVPNYRQKPVFLNIGPPAFGDFGYAGMDPNDIKDPVARAKYLSARRENISNGISNHRQLELESLGGEMGPNLVNELIQTFTVWDNSAATLAKCMKEARLTDKEKKEVETALAQAKTWREKQEAEDRKSDETIRTSKETSKGVGSRFYLMEPAKGLGKRLPTPLPVLGRGELG